MGPSGSGKSTLLNVLAHRPAPRKARIQGDTLVNHTSAPLATFRQISCYVEQEDSLIGSLTAKETLDFAARLSLPRHDNHSWNYLAVRSANIEYVAP